MVLLVCVKTTKNAKIRLFKGFKEVGDIGGETCWGQSPVQTLILNLFLIKCIKTNCKKISLFEKNHILKTNVNLKKIVTGI